jgi:Zn-dependent protease with chaperone function
MITVRGDAPAEQRQGFVVGILSVEWVKGGMRVSFLYAIKFRRIARQAVSGPVPELRINRAPVQQAFFIQREKSWERTTREVIKAVAALLASSATTPASTMRGGRLTFIMLPPMVLQTFCVRGC